MLVMRGKSTVPGPDTSTAFTVKNRCCLSCFVVVSPDDNNPLLFPCRDGKEVRCCKAHTEGHRGWMVRMDLSTETHDCAKAPDILSLSLSSATKKCTVFGSCMYEVPKILIKPSISYSFDCRCGRAKATAIAIASAAIELRSHCNSPKTLTDRKGRRGEKPGRDARKTTRVSSIRSGWRASIFICFSVLVLLELWSSTVSHPLSCAKKQAAGKLSAVAEKFPTSSPLVGRELRCHSKSLKHSCSVWSSNCLPVFRKEFPHFLGFLGAEDVVAWSWEVGQVLGPCFRVSSIRVFCANRKLSEVQQKFQNRKSSRTSVGIVLDACSWSWGLNHETSSFPLTTDLSPPLVKISMNNQCAL